MGEDVRASDGGSVQPSHYEVNAFRVGVYDWWTDLVANFVGGILRVRFSSEKPKRNKTCEAAAGRPGRRTSQNAAAAESIAKNTAESG